MTIIAVLPVSRAARDDVNSQYTSSYSVEFVWRQQVVSPTTAGMEPAVVMARTVTPGASVRPVETVDSRFTARTKRR
jgi:hypothetical protein